MNPSTHKKVLLRLWTLPSGADDGGMAASVAAGIIDPNQLGRSSKPHGPNAPASPTAPDAIDLLTPEGQALRLERASIQAVFFLSSFDHTAALRGNGYLGRLGPRMPGLWVRLRCRDHQTLEGILATDLLELDAGVTLSPLYRDSIWQRIFVPRAAIEQITPVEMVRAPRRRHPRAQLEPEAPRQFGLFPPAAIETTREGAQ